MYNSSRWEDRFGAINGTLAFIEMESKSADVIDYVWTYIVGERFD